MAVLLLTLSPAAFAQDTTPPVEPPTTIPSDTPLPPSDTPIPPSPTPVPPTDTDTPLPPTDTDTPLPPTETATASLMPAPIASETPIASTTLPTDIPPIVTWTPIFSDPFTTPSLLDWSFTGSGWGYTSQSDGNGELRVFNNTSPALYQGLVLTDAAVEVSVDVSHGNAHIFTRHSDSGSYQAQLTSTGDVAILRSGVVLMTTRLSDFLPLEPHRLRLNTFGNHLWVEVDGQTQFNFTDVASLPAGRAGIAASFAPAQDVATPAPPQHTVIFDDFVLYQPAEQITPSPVPTHISVTPTPSMTATASVTATISETPTRTATNTGVVTPNVRRSVSPATPLGPLTLATGTPQPNNDLIINGNFNNGLANWSFSGSTQQITNGALLIAPTTSGGGFFQTIPYSSGGEIFEVNLRAGNNSAATKTLNLIVHDSGWTASYNCVFNLPANAPVQYYTMRFDTTSFNPMILQGALSGDSTLGLLIDDITMVRKVGITVSATECIVAPPANTNLIANPEFDQGTLNWAAFNATMQTVNSGGLNPNRMEIARNANTPNGGFYQYLPYSAPANRVFEVSFAIGNQSNQTRVINMLIRNPEWTDVHSCFITIPPNTTSTDTNYNISFTTAVAWSNIVFQGWIQVGDYTGSGVLPFRVDTIWVQYKPTSGFTGTTQCRSRVPHTATPTPSPTATPTVVRQQITILFGGSGGDTTIDGPDPICQTPPWVTIVDVPLFYDAPKSNHANIGLAVPGVADADVFVIGYSAGGDSALMFADRYLQARNTDGRSGRITGLLLLGATLTGETGSGSLTNTWQSIIQSALTSGTHIYVYDDNNGAFNFRWSTFIPVLHP
jgi:hypothetical protein